MKKFILYIPAILWSLFILLGSLSSGNKIPVVKIPHLDKMIHFGLYFVLTGFFLFAHFYKQPPLFLPLIVISMYCSIYGGIIEILQEILTPDRTGEFLDMVANICGCIFGALFYRYLFKPVVNFRNNR